MVTTAELTARLGVDKANALRWLKPTCAQLGIPLHKTRLPGGTRQPTFVWTDEDAERLLTERARQGYSVNGEAPAVMMADTQGVFYALQTIPELSPKRIKVGFATNLDRRMASHRCTVPTAKLLGAWPCEGTDEPFLLRCVAACPSAHRVGTEVFDIDPSEVVERLDRLFELLGISRVA